jgi:hypothetical protein
MHPNAEVSTRNLGRISSSPHDRANDHSVAGRSGARGDRDTVPDLEIRPRGERFVDGDRARLWLSRRYAGATDRRWVLEEERGEQKCKHAES